MHHHTPHLPAGHRSWMPHRRRCCWPWWCSRRWSSSGRGSAGGVPQPEPQRRRRRGLSPSGPVPLHGRVSSFGRLLVQILGSRPDGLPSRSAGPLLRRSGHGLGSGAPSHETVVGEDVPRVELLDFGWGGTAQDTPRQPGRDRWRAAGDRDDPVGAGNVSGPSARGPRSRLRQPEPAASSRAAEVMVAPTNPPRAVTTDPAVGRAVSWRGLRLATMKISSWSSLGTTVGFGTLATRHEIHFLRGSRHECGSMAPLAHVAARGRAAPP